MCVNLKFQNRVLGFDKKLKINFQYDCKVHVVHMNVIYDVGPNKRDSVPKLSINFSFMYSMEFAS